MALAVRNPSLLCTRCTVWNVQRLNILEGFTSSRRIHDSRMARPLTIKAEPLPISSLMVSSGQMMLPNYVTNIRGFSKSSCAPRIYRIKPTRISSKLRDLTSSEEEGSLPMGERLKGIDQADTQAALNPDESSIRRDERQNDAGFTGTSIINEDVSSNPNRATSQHKIGRMNQKVDGQNVASQTKNEARKDERVVERTVQSKFQFKHSGRKGEVEVISGGRYRDKGHSQGEETVSADLLEIDSERFSSKKKKKQKKREEPTTEGRHHSKDSHNRKADLDHLHVGVARGNDLLFGISPCLLALQQLRRQVHNVYMIPAFTNSSRSEIGEIQALMEERGMRVTPATRHSLDRLAGKRPHQGIAMETSRLYYQPAEDSEEEKDTPSAVTVRLVLDQIKDPMNLGAMLRSAYFLGIDKVIVSKKNCCSLTPVVSKASSGVMEVLSVHATEDLPAFLTRERARGWSIIGAAPTGSDPGSAVVPCHDYDTPGPVILVVGSEGFGLSRYIQDMCSELITIPPGRQLHPGVDSLNVSVATGILLHALLGKG